MRAAVGLAPVAINRRPHAERCRNQNVSPPATIQTSRTVGMPHRFLPDMATRIGVAAVLACINEAMTISAPSTRLAIASVMTRGGTLKTVMPTPLSAPTRKQHRQASAILTRRQEEPRAGKERVRTCRTRGRQYQ